MGNMYFIKDFDNIIGISQINVGNGNSVDPSRESFGFSKFSASSFLSTLINYDDVTSDVDNWAPELQMDYYNPNIILDPSTDFSKDISFDVYFASRGFMLPESKRFDYNSLIEFSQKNLLFIPDYRWFATADTSTTATFAELFPEEDNIDIVSILNSANLTYLDNIPIVSNEIGDLSSYLENNPYFKVSDNVTVNNLTIKESSFGYFDEISYKDSPENFSFLDRRSSTTWGLLLKDYLLDGTTKICIVYDSLELFPNTEFSLDTLKEFLKSLTFKIKTYWVVLLEGGNNLNATIYPNYKVLVESDKDLKIIEPTAGNVSVYRSNIFYAKSINRIYRENTSESINEISKEDALKDFNSPLDISFETDGIFSVSYPNDQTYSLELSREIETIPTTDLSYKITVKDS